MKIKPKRTFICKMNRYKKKWNGSPCTLESFTCLLGCWETYCILDKTLLIRHLIANWRTRTDWQIKRRKMLAVPQWVGEGERECVSEWKSVWGRKREIGAGRGRDRRRGRERKESNGSWESRTSIYKKLKETLILIDKGHKNHHIMSSTQFDVSLADT